MNYSERLKELREEQELTLQEVASNLNISRSVYGRYEKEHDIIPINHLISVANFFDVSIDYIFCFTNIRKYNSFKEVSSLNAGKRLKSWRKESNLTQYKLADILNTVQPVIANYEKGKFMIATPFLYTICKKYNISADYLLGRIDTPVLKH